ncbi:MAG: LysM peptidoglycan-binding domain-containing protein [Christensenellales bacterium]|jgi:spore germination protein YaaH
MEMLTIHKMRRTDRLEMLSVYYRVPICMIIRANAFTDVQDIFSCKEIKIPKKCYCNRCADAHRPAMQYEIYTVLPTDTLYGIAKKYGVTMQIILRTNNIEDAGKIRTGDKLSIPVISGELYCVRTGESIEDIALKHNISVNSIREKNCLGPNDEVLPGMQLMLN